MKPYFLIAFILLVFDVCRGASPDNTSIPPASSVTDNSGNVWTLSSGYIYVNGAKRTDASNVVELYWHNHTTYVGSYGSQPGEITQKNTSGQYFKYIRTKWIQCVDPRLGGTSADGTMLNGTPGTYIIDKACNTWTLSNGYIYKQGPADMNATKDSSLSNVNLLLWYGGLIYRSDTNGQYYVLPNNDIQPKLITQRPINTISPWLPCTDPRVAKAANTGSFYGINGHPQYPDPPFSPNVTVGLLKDLGCTIYRTNVVSQSKQLTTVVNLAKAFQSAGLKLLPVLIYNSFTFRNSTTEVLYPDEDTAYKTLKAEAATISTALAPYGVDTYECGNEMTLDSAIRLSLNGIRLLGSTPKDFNNTNWPIMRGVIRGMIDGIRSVQPTARCGVNFVLTDIAAADMLWDGKQPDGTSGYPQVRWNITTWHNYGPYGQDIFNSGIGDNANWNDLPGINIPVYVKARYGVPFWITEWNAMVNLTINPHFNETDRANYIQQTLPTYFNARNVDAIESTMLYELTNAPTGDDVNWWGIIYNNLTVVQPTYNTFQTFVEQHPDI